MKKFGKKYRAAAEKVDKNKIYSIADACKLVCETSPVKFDATVEIHISTGTNPKHSDQIIRSTVVLPHGTGKKVRVAVFCDETEFSAAKKAGADLTGADDLLEKIGKGEINFDVLIAHPAKMKELAKVAKVLGPKGLMPNPKSGTVTNKIAEAVEQIKKGKIEFRNDKAGIVHSILGKVSFGEKKITENFQTFLAALKENKPSGTKGNLLKKVFLTTAMGPSIAVDIVTD